MAVNPQQYETALIASNQPDHWPRYVLEKTQRLKVRQQIANIPQQDDRARILAYQMWNDLYHNRPEYFKIICRDDGDDEDVIEIYLPGAKKVIEATNRFLCVGFDFNIDNETGTDNEQSVIDTLMTKLFKRERFYAKFAQQKRYCLIKGDAVWHLTADPSKRKGQRISLNPVPPENYFPIEDEFTGRVMGCHIVDIITNPKNSKATKTHRFGELARRQTYRRAVDSKGRPTGRITSELAYFTVGKWDDRTEETAKDVERVETIVQEFTLPQPISQIPVYHIRNNPPMGSTFGVSEIAGSELLVKAMNQSISDEDLTLIMQGLGVYWTDAAPPVDAYGNEVPWELGPSKVVQVGQDGKFGRVSGVSSVAPYSQHISDMNEHLLEGSGTPDIAVGKVDVPVAESGIALQLKLGPLLAKNAEKELEWCAIHEQLFFDLINMWFVAYEGLPAPNVEVDATCDDPTPQNRQAKVAELLELWSMGIFPVDKMYLQLNELGYDFEDGDFDQAVADNTLIAHAASGGMFDTPGQGGEFGEEPPPDEMDQMPPQAQAGPTGGGAH